MLKRVCRVGLGVVLGLVVAQPAFATTRFADPGSSTTSGQCTGALGNPACRIDYAFSVAQAGDTVSLAAGSYTLAATIDVTKRLDVVATDPTGPRPLVQTNASSQLPLKLDTGSNGSTVTHVAFTQLQSGSTAVQVMEGAALSDDVFTSPATCIQMFSSTATVTLDHDTANQTGSSAGYTCIASGAGPVQVSHSTSTAPIGIALTLANGAVTTSTLSGTIALQLAPGATQTATALQDTVSGTTVGANINGGALISDSVVTTTTGIAVETLSTGTAENVTAIGTGPGSVAFEAVASGFPVKLAGALTVRNAIGRAATDIKADPTPTTCPFPPCSPGQLHIDHSDFTSTSGTIDDRGGNISGDPLFAGAASGDYHLLRGSAASDAGIADANMGFTDFDGNARVVGPAPDMGAFEYQGGAPVLGAGSVTNVGQTSATLHGTVDAGDLPTSVVFEYGTSAAYGVAAAPQSVPARLGGAPVTEKLLGLVPGRTYHARIRASNALGAPAGSDITFTTLPGDAPRVSGFRYSPARFREHGSKSRRRGRHQPPPVGTHMRFTLSAAASVQVTLSKPLTGRRRNGRCLAPVKRPTPKGSRCILYVGRGTLSLGLLGAGSHAIAFRGRVGRTMLAPGTYRATIVALGANGTLASNRQNATFTVVR